MSKKGWWRRIQNDDYPETQTNYGDHRAANWRPESGFKPVNLPYAPIQLEEIYPKCDQMYWKDKGCCHNCGYNVDPVSSEKPEISNSSNSDLLVEKKRDNSILSKMWKQNGITDSMKGYICRPKILGLFKFS